MPTRGYLECAVDVGWLRRVFGAEWHPSDMTYSGPAMRDNGRQDHSKHF